MNERLIDAISQFIFINDTVQKSDVIFIPGGAYAELGESAAALYNSGFAPYVMPSGKYGLKCGCFQGPKSKRELYNDVYPTEFDFLKAVLKHNGVPDSAILEESAATFTYENALFSKRQLEAMGIQVKKAILCCKSFHARRAYMYYQSVFPEIELIVCPYPFEMDGTMVTADNWFESEVGIKFVMGELERCGQQFKAILLEGVFLNGMENY